MLIKRGMKEFFGFDILMRCQYALMHENDYSD